MIKTYGDRQPGLGTSAIVGALTLAKTGTTARTATFPDAAITVAGSAAALTSGRVPYVTTGGLLTDSANLTFGAATGIVTIGSAAQAFNARIDLNSASGYNRGILLQTGSASRWFLFADTAAESGADAGSTFTIRAYTDAGASIDSPISIVRASGGAITLARPVTCTGAVTVPNGTAAAPGIRLTSDAHGLFRNSATTLGFSVGGVGACVLYARNAGAFGGALLFNGSAADEPGVICNVLATTHTIIGGGSTVNVGGQVKVYGQTHATKANYIEFVRTSTVSAYFDGSGILTVNNTTDATTTSDGSVRLSGGLSVAKNIVTGQSALFTAATAAGTTAGQLQRETNQDKLYAYANGIGGWLDKCIFSQYASVTQSGIVTDQSLASATARGTRTLPANFFKQGKVLKFRLCGRYTTDAAAGNATIQIKLGTTVFRTSGSFALDNSVTNLPWELEGEIICLTTGASGTVEGISLWKHMITGATGNYDAEALAGTTSVTLDTTASQTFDVVWTADDAGTAITCTCFRLWEVC